MNPPLPQPTFPIGSVAPTILAPLPAAGLFEIGATFHREALRHNVLSLFWRNCCQPPYYCRAPAPVLELSNDANRLGEPRRRTAAWWLLSTGIVSDADGPYSRRLHAFFGIAGEGGHLWPKYEFAVTCADADTAVVLDMSIYTEPVHRWRQRIRHVVDERGFLTVAERQPLSSR